MKTLLLGILLIILIGIGGLVYRNAAEHPNQPIACPIDTKTCPDGTTVTAVGTSCEFPACPPPNVSLEEYGITFALPAEYMREDPGELFPAVVYTNSAIGTSTDSSASISIRRYQIAASSTALATIQATAIGGASGAPVPATAYSSTNINGRQFTVVSIERFEGTVDTAYYLARENDGDVLRFDAIDRGVMNWTDAALDVTTLPAQSALRRMLATLGGQ